MPPSLNSSSTPVTPLALEVALTVQAELETRADEADRLRLTHVERARHRAEQARRRYLSVDPDNRLVADTLEADWNDALRQLRDTQDDYDRATAAAQAALTDEHKARVRSLAADFPALWADPATPARERKRMTRLLIDDVTLTKTDRIGIHVRFRGGTTTSLTTPVPPRAWQLRQTHPDVLAALDLLLNDHTDAETAHQLNLLGHRSGEHKPFTARIVLGLRRDHDIPSHADRLRARGMLTIGETAQRLGVHTATIKDWDRAGLLISHRANDKNERLFEPPTPGDLRLVKRMGSRLAKRVPHRTDNRRCSGSHRLVLRLRRPGRVDQAGWWTVRSTLRCPGAALIAGAGSISRSGRSSSRRSRRR